MNNIRKTIGIASLVLTGMLTTICYGQQQDTNYSWKGYPSTAKKEDTKLLIERKVPKTVRPNKAYSYELKVTNRSSFKLDEIVLQEKIPAGFKLTKVYPQPDKKVGNVLIWDFGYMAPGEREIITITGVATRPGKIIHRGNADLNFHLGQMTAIMDVVNPSLLFDIEAKKDLIIGEVFPATFTFTNNGTAAVLNGVLKHKLTGISTSTGNSYLSIPLPTMLPGDTVTKRLKFKAVKTGQFSNTFVVKASDGVTASKTMLSVVKQPKLKISGTAPEMRYVGNNILYTINIKNSGNGVAKNLTAKLSIPSGTKVVSADEGGKALTNGVVWSLASLEPGASKTITAKVKGLKIMKVPATAYAEAFAAPQVSTQFNTDVQGIPALLLKVDDVEDPVATGENAIYKIYVTNQGSKAAAGVKVVCTLEKTMKYVASKGPSKAKVTGNTIVFDAIRELPIGKTAVYEVSVKALKEGDVRFRADVNCQQLKTPVTEFESTNFYED